VPRPGRLGIENVGRLIGPQRGLQAAYSAVSRTRSADLDAGVLRLELPNRLFHERAFGTSAAQWLQKVNSLTCCALAAPAQQTADNEAAIRNERVLARTGFLQLWRDAIGDLDWLDA
jgi:hypothetical protein